MSKMALGIIITFITLAALLASAANAANPSASRLLLIVAVVGVIGLVGLAGRGALSPAAAKPVEEKFVGEWQGWQKTLGVVALGLVCLLSWGGLFIAIHAGYGTWVAFPAIGMVVIWLTLIVVFSSGITERKG